MWVGCGWTGVVLVGQCLDEGDAVVVRLTRPAGDSIMSRLVTTKPGLPRRRKCSDAWRRVATVAYPI